MKHNILCVSLAMYFISSAGCTYTTINTRQHQVVFKYSREHRSERDLPICGETEVCSILHKRFWLAPLAERLCRCGINDECPWKWTNNSDAQTMLLNSRSQLKFCSSIKNREPCDPKEPALILKTVNINNHHIRRSMTVSCSCDEGNYWKYYKTSRGANKINGTTKFRKEYKCAPLKKCETMEFCGNVRADQNSIYYSCSCPEGHYCVFSDKTQRKVHELLYSGSGYKAFCEPVLQNDGFYK